jgi:GR25 family glycosyltransferase involved in LPS biosynthesis
VEVFLSPCDDTLPPGPKGNAEVSRRAIEFALELGRGILFCEDDIDLAPDFRAALGAAITHPSAVTYFYQHEGARMRINYGPILCALILEGISVHSGLYPLSGPGRRGAQCLYIPRGVLERFPLGELHGGAPIDICLDRWLDRLGIPALVALPNPVQHRHSRVARAAEQSDIKRSKSFDLERIR